MSASGTTDASMCTRNAPTKINENGSTAWLEVCSSLLFSVFSLFQLKNCLLCLYSGLKYFSAPFEQLSQSLSTSYSSFKRFRWFVPIVSFIINFGFSGFSEYSNCWKRKFLTNRFRFQMAFRPSYGMPSYPRECVDSRRAHAYFINGAWENVAVVITHFEFTKIYIFTFRLSATTTADCFWTDENARNTCEFSNVFLIFKILNFSLRQSRKLRSKRQRLFSSEIYRRSALMSSYRRY